MKLSTNGNFCLLYVEAADNKQSLFATISEQSRPVFLLMSLEGQPRSGLFQQPEDFRDLKVVRRESGVSIIFLTSGDERLAQMAERHGFPAYQSMDDFTNSLVRKRASAPIESLASLNKFRMSLLESSADSFLLQLPIPTRIPGPAASGDSWAGQEGDLEFDTSSMTWREIKSSTSPVSEAGSMLRQEAASDAFAALPASIQLRARPTQANATRVFSPSTPLPGFAADSITAAAQKDSRPPRQRAEQQATHPFSRESRELTLEGLNREAMARLSAPLVQQAPNVAERASDAVLERVPTLVTPVRVEPPLAEKKHIQVLSPSDHPPMVDRSRKRRRVRGWLILLVLLLLGSGVLGSLFTITHMQAAASAPVEVGSVTFQSSEQFSKNSNQGIDDQVWIRLHDLSAPTSGKSYYAWLLGDKGQEESPTIPLGKLNVVGGSATLFYPGDAAHTNLLQITSRFLVTAEDNSFVPILPSPDLAAWHYYGVFPAMPDPNDVNHFSFLNHLRHLLSNEPVLTELNLQGGLNSWFERNTQKLIGLTSSARDHWQNSPNPTSVRSQGIQILSYLDGLPFLLPDVPPASAHVQVSLDTHQAALGLLTVRGSTQKPPSYVEQIAYHLNGLLNSPGSPASTRVLVSQLLPVLSSVTNALQQVRNDDMKLLALSDAQLGSSAQALLDDMVLETNNAYTGDPNSSVSQSQQGVVWMHQQLQSIATITVSQYQV